MAALPEELILEIISYLPLKFLVQCKCLNKNFNLFISDPLFQSQHAFYSSTTFDCLLYSHYCPRSSILSKVDLHQSHDDTKVPELRLPSSSSSGSALPCILSSSGGLLLLKFRCPSLCVFNPITGAYRFIPPSPAGATYISLVSELANPSSFKLVAVCRQSVENKLSYIFKIFNSDESYKWRTSHTTCSSNKIKLIDNVYQTAYLDDSLYWLIEDGEILVFNVKTEQAKIINQSEDVQNRLVSSLGACLGVSQDKLAMAINAAGENKISIYLYDSVHGKWKADKLLLDHAYVNGKGYTHSYPVFYDGERLIQLLVTARGQKNELYMYDVVANSCRKIATMPNYWSYDPTQKFRHFFGTLAKIPRCSYINIQEKYWNSEILEILLRMQKNISSDT